MRNFQPDHTTIQCNGCPPYWLICILRFCYKHIYNYSIMKYIAYKTLQIVSSWVETIVHQDRYDHAPENMHLKINKLCHSKLHSGQLRWLSAPVPILTLLYHAIFLMSFPQLRMPLIVITSWFFMRPHRRIYKAIVTLPCDFRAMTNILLWWY